MNGSATMLGMVMYGCGNRIDMIGRSDDERRYAVKKNCCVVMVFLSIIINAREQL